MARDLGLGAFGTGGGGAYLRTKRRPDQLRGRSPARACIASSSSTHSGVIFGRGAGLSCQTFHNACTWALRAPTFCVPRCFANHLDPTIPSVVPLYVGSTSFWVRP